MLATAILSTLLMAIPAPLPEPPVPEDAPPSTRDCLRGAAVGTGVGLVAGTVALGLGTVPVQAAAVGRTVYGGTGSVQTWGRSATVGMVETLPARLGLVFLADATGFLLGALPVMHQHPQAVAATVLATAGITTVTLALLAAAQLLVPLSVSGNASAGVQGMAWSLTMAGLAAGVLGGLVLRPLALVGTPWMVDSVLRALEP